MYYNAEHYPDPTAGAALTEIERAELRNVFLAGLQEVLLQFYYKAALVIPNIVVKLWYNGSELQRRLETQGE
jgi:hypothetical protein